MPCFIDNDKDPSAVIGLTGVRDHHLGGGLQAACADRQLPVPRSAVLVHERTPEGAYELEPARCRRLPAIRAGANWRICDVETSQCWVPLVMSTVAPELGAMVTVTDVRRSGGGTFAARIGNGNDGGVGPGSHHLGVDNDPSDIRPGGDVVHDVEENLFEDGSKAASTGAAL